MKIKTLVVGSYQTNCYILHQERNVLIIDPGDEFSKIKEEVGEDKVVGILLTHRHFDHIGALEECVKYYHAPVFEYNTLEEKEYQIDNFYFQVYFTKGHTDDSVIYLLDNQKMIFTGDFIFHESIGRTDLGGNDEDMQESIRKFIQITKHRKEYSIYPGHGSQTNVIHELIYNPYLQIKGNPIL